MVSAKFGVYLHSGVKYYDRKMLFFDFLIIFAFMSGNQNIKYLLSAKRDESWGITVNTVGKQSIEKGYSTYPPQEKHPEGFYFDVHKGRILDSWQLLYIYSGKGTFYTADGKMQDINCGDMILLKPGVWHSYLPSRETGWEEYWIGFRGPVIDDRNASGLLKKNIYRVGVREDIVSQYNDAIQIAVQEKPSYQQYLAGTVNMLLGLSIYYDANKSVSESYAADKIDGAKALMKERFRENLDLEKIAQDAGMSYSWFRKKFREYTSISPARYILGLRIQEACRLLAESPLTIKEVAYNMNFEDSSYFSAMFLREVGMSPSEYRRRFQVNFL